VLKPFSESGCWRLGSYSLWYSSGAAQTAVVLVFSLYLFAAWVPAFAIVNGDDVSDDRFATEFPWMVAVVNKNNGGVCGGALIAPRWVLTAAHCTGMNRYVLAGSPERSAARRFEVLKAKRHPDFDKTEFANDIGLLYLDGALETELVSIATADAADQLLKRGMRAHIAGWGKTAAGGRPADRLVVALTFLYSLQREDSRYVYRDPNTGPCGYDSGGPMIINPDAGRAALVGVASGTQGNLCRQGGGTAIYTDVSKMLQFIEDKMGQDFRQVGLSTDAD